MICQNVEDLKKLIKKTKFMKFTEEFLDYVCGTPEETLKVYNRFSLLLLGLNSTICEMAEMYNTVLNDILENTVSDEIITDSKKQEQIGKVVYEIYRLQFLKPIYMNIDYIEKELQKEKRKCGGMEGVAKVFTEYLKDIETIRFNIEEFEYFLETKPFGELETGDIGIEYK